MDLALALDQDLAPNPDDQAVVASARATNIEHPGWGPTSRGKARVFALPDDAALQKVDFLSILRKGFSGPGKEAQEARDFVVKYQAQFCASLSTIFGPSTKGKHVVIVSHGRADLIQLHEGNITLQSEFTGRSAAWRALTILGCGCGAPNGIAERLAKATHGSVTANPMTFTWENVKLYSNLNEQAQGEFRRLLEELSYGKHNYFQFEQRWKEIYEAHKKNESDYAYWDFRIKHLDKFVQYK